MAKKRRKFRWERKKLLTYLKTLCQQALAVALLWGYDHVSVLTTAFRDNLQRVLIAKSVARLENKSRRRESATKQRDRLHGSCAFWMRGLCLLNVWFAWFLNAFRVGKAILLKAGSQWAHDKFISCQQLPPVALLMLKSINTKVGTQLKICLVKGSSASFLCDMDGIFRGV